jgi:alpha-L-fucosidase 2
MTRFLLSSLCLLTIAWSLSASSPDNRFRALGINDPRRAATADSPASRWETALMTGNGETGALVMGRVQDETVILTRAGLFLPLSPPLDPPSQGAHLPEIRAMIAAGDYQKAADFLVQIAEKEGYRGTHWVDPFVPVCSLKIERTSAGEPREYLRSVDYSTGVVATHWVDERGTFVQRVFASRSNDVVVVALSRDSAPVDCTLRFVHHDPSVTHEKDKLHTQAFSDVITRAEDKSLIFRSRFSAQWERAPKGAFARARIVTDGGSVVSEADALKVSGARQVVVILKVGADPDLRGPKEEEVAEALRRLPSDFETLLKAHVAVHGELFARSRLELGGSAEDHRLTAKQLFAKSALGKPLPALIEKQYDACRYLILSSTGRYFPPTLQGIWSGTWNPPWASAFTHDGNVPVAVIGNLPANLPELMEGYFSYHERHLEDYRRNARRLFNADGIVVPAHSTSHGLHNHFGPRWCLTFWSAGAAWAAHYFYDYYLYTGDEHFLRTRAVPFMKETVAFYEDFLEGMIDAEGFAVFSPSYSPENDPANTKSQATINATMDIVACREVLQNLIASCEKLGIEKENIGRWSALLKTLRPYRINEDGAVAEWITPLLQDNYAHRHVSHLYELYDTLPEHIGSDESLMQAFKVAVQKRTQWRREIGGGEMAFGQAQMGAVAAALRLPDIAFENLDMLANWFWFRDSMMTAHNPESLFNTDIAGGIPQLIIRMLLDSQPGWIEILPAVPTAWPTGKIEGVLCRGRVEVKTLEWTPESASLVLQSPVDQTVELRSHGATERKRVELKANTPLKMTLSR